MYMEGVASTFFVVRLNVTLPLFYKALFLFHFPPSRLCPVLFFIDAVSFVEQHQPRRFKSSKQAHKGNGPGGVSSY